jgi:dTDP-4-amino-4,6-dideoxygalactose transaminase
VLSAASFLSGRGKKPATVLDAGQVRHVTSGRVAIALALLHLEIKAGDEVAVPAFHCTSMIEPVTWRKATPVFYRIKRDASVDLADLEIKISNSTRALLITHYFGFLQDVTTLRSFCDRNGIALIEDCAHCLFGEVDGKPVGATADYAIASLAKFFPTYDGGCLISSRHRLDHIALESAGLAFDAKAALNTIEYALEHARLSVLTPVISLPLKVKDRIWRSVKRANDTPIAPGSADGGYGFDPAWINKRASLATRLVSSGSSLARIYHARRRNFLKLHDALGDLPGAEPLFTNLPEGVAPYVYPLKTARISRVFPALKLDGVPILRFGEFLVPETPAGVCAVTADLSGNLLQFPCHQDLTADELDWMINRIVAIFRETA